jgi:hypothetical protein
LDFARMMARPLDALADPPVYLLVMLAYYAARRNRAGEARQLAEQALACEPYPPPLDICIVLIATLTLVECYDALQQLCDDLLAAARRRGAMRETIADPGLSGVAEGVHRMHAVSEVIRVLIERDLLQAAEDELEQCANPGSGECWSSLLSLRDRRANSVCASWSRRASAAELRSGRAADQSRSVGPRRSLKTGPRSARLIESAASVTPHASRRRGGGAAVTRGRTGSTG